MPFDNSREEDLGVAAGAGPFAKLLAPSPAMDEVSKGLVALKDYHSNPKNWCNTGPSGGDSYCIAAACGRINFPMATRLFPYLVAALPPEAQEFGENGIIHFNERMGTTHKQLMAFYDRAIAARRAELAS